jgi:hypothetical protein
MPAVRSIVRRTGARDFKFSALVLEIASSTPFQKGMKPVPPGDARKSGD